MSLQDQSQAKLDTVLQQRFSAHLLQISDDILNEPTSTPNHYLRKFIITKTTFNNSNRLQVAVIMLGRAISNNALTLPIINEDVPGPPNQIVQTQPTDTEIQNAVNGYMADAEFLLEIALATF